MTPEQKVKNQFCAWLSFHKRKLGIRKFWYNPSTGIWDPKRQIFRKKNSRFDLKGVSDVLGILEDGGWLALEFKTDTEKNLLGEYVSRRTYPTKEQQEFLDLVNETGGVGRIIRSMWDAEELEQTLLKRKEEKAKTIA